MAMVKTVSNVEELMRVQKKLERSGFKFIGNGTYRCEKKNITVSIIWK